ncbi:MAG: PLP-dependent aminotransferase family protein [Novosphingobium sp.]|nr:PLP-dependent aminotransferase family protein [Novosphingobium sp.]
MHDVFSTHLSVLQMPDHGLRGLGRPGVIAFGGGLPDPAMHPVAALDRLFREVLSGNDLSVLGYGHDQGDMRLREAIAARAAGVADAANVVVTTGSADGIGLVARAMLDPGDVVIAEAATYPGALKAFRLMGAEVIATPVDGEGLVPDCLADVLEGLASQGRRVKLLYTIATCHNPTTTILAADRRRAILELARRHDFFVLDDNTYAEIRFGETPPSFAALDPDRGIDLGSFSKVIAPGLRMGWVVARKDIAEGINRARTDLGSSPLVQRVVARFIESGELGKRLPLLSAHYRSKRDRMLAGLERHCTGLAEWTIPDGGFFVWLRLLQGDAMSALASGDREGVTFIPGMYFAATGGGLTDALRLSYGEVTVDEMDEGLVRLGRALAG